MFFLFFFGSSMHYSYWSVSPLHLPNASFSQRTCYSITTSFQLENLPLCLCCSSNVAYQDINQSGHSNKKVFSAEFCDSRKTEQSILGYSRAPLVQVTPSKARGLQSLAFASSQALPYTTPLVHLMGSYSAVQKPPHFCCSIGMELATVTTAKMTATNFIIISVMMFVLKRKKKKLFCQWTRGKKKKGKPRANCLFAWQGATSLYMSHSLSDEPVEQALLAKSVRVPSFVSYQAITAVKKPSYIIAPPRWRLFSVILVRRKKPAHAFTPCCGSAPAGAFRLLPVGLAPLGNVIGRALKSLHCIDEVLIVKNSINRRGLSVVYSKYFASYYLISGFYYSLVTPS